MRYVEGIEAAARYSVIGLATWRFGGRDTGGAGVDAAGAGRVVARARELGITVFDTAEVSGFGRGERILGAALRDSGGTDDVVVATKILPVLPTAAAVQRHAVASARRLGVQRLDLYQLQQPHPVVPDATTMRGMRALRDAGVVDQVGVGSYPLRRWQRAEPALGGRILSNQVQLSLVSRGPLEHLVPWAGRTGHVVLAWSPLAGGLLADGGVADAAAPPDRRRGPAGAMLLPERPGDVVPLRTALRDIGAAHGATPGQVALAWVVHHRHVVALVEAASPAEVEHHAAAAQITLGAGEYGALTAAAETFAPRTGFSAFPGLVRGRARRG
jgi:aryl-alcohol dehydrogenase-like predicted oxidoreductase